MHMTDNLYKLCQIYDSIDLDVDYNDIIESTNFAQLHHIIALSQLMSAITTFKLAEVSLARELAEARR